MFSLLSLQINLLEKGWADEELAMNDSERLEVQSRTWFEVWYTVLRRHYGEYLLPPLEIMQSSIQGNDSPFMNWYFSFQPERESRSISLYTAQNETHYFISLSSAQQCPGESQTSRDLIDFRPEDTVRIWFDHVVGKEDDSYLIQSLFLPLLQTLPRFNLTLQSFDVQATYVNGTTGLHIAPLERLLTELSLVED